MSNRSATYTLNLNSNVNRILMETEQTAARLDGVMGGLNNTLRFFGLGFAGHAIVSAGKEWIQAAADYESAMVRIKNVSQDATDGIRNQMFIKSEVDKFKIDIQSATDAYGDFLVKIGSSGLAGEQVRKLHDEVLMISKVTATPQSKMDAAVRDIGIMLGEGVLEARHLRALSYVFPQITGFLAEEMGMKDHHGLDKVTGAKTDESARQQLAHLISSGKLTKAALDSEVLLNAVEKYAKSLEGGLAESLATTQSGIEDLHNTWLEFKNDFTLDHKSGILEMFESLKGGIGILDKNAESILTTATIVTELYLTYKAISLLQAGGLAIETSMLAIFASQFSMKNAIAASQARADAAEIAADHIEIENLYEQHTLELRRMALKYEMGELDIIEETHWRNMNNLLMEANASMEAFVSNTVLAGESTAVVAMNQAKSGMGALIGGAGRIAGAGAIAVGIAWIASEVAEQMGLFGKKADGTNKSKWDSLGTSDWAQSDEGLFQALKNGTFAIGGGAFLTEREADFKTRLQYFADKGLTPEFDKDGSFKSMDDVIKHQRGIMAHQNLVQTQQSQILGITGFGASGYNTTVGVAPFSQAYLQNQLLYGGGAGFETHVDPNSPSSSGNRSGGAKAGVSHLIGKDTKSSAIRGNSVTNISINIQELNGIKTATFSVKNSKDMKDIEETVGMNMARILTGVVNDSQIVKH